MRKNKKTFFKVLTLCLSALLLSGFFGLRKKQETQAAPRAGITLKGSRKILSRRKGIWVFVGEKGSALELRVRGKQIRKGVKWYSDDSSVAKVSRRGVVTAKRNGYAQIRAKYGRKTYRLPVNVGTRAERIILKRDRLTEPLGEILDLSYGESKAVYLEYKLPQSAIEKGSTKSTYNWYAESSDTEILEILQTNQVRDVFTIKALKPGKAYVTVFARQASIEKAKGKYSISKTLHVTVKEKTDNVKVLGLLDEKFEEYRLSTKNSPEVNAKAKLYAQIVDVKGKPAKTTEGITIQFDPGTTGLKLDTDKIYDTVKEIKGKSYIEIPLLNHAEMKAGKAKVSFRTENLGMTIYEFTVSDKEDSVLYFEIKEPKKVFAKEINEFFFIAKNREKKDVTSYEILTDPEKGVKLPSGFHFEREANGAPSLIYDPEGDRELNSEGKEQSLKKSYTILDGEVKKEWEMKVLPMPRPKKIIVDKIIGAQCYNADETEDFVRKIKVIDEEDREIPWRELQKFDDLYLGIDCEKPIFVDIPSLGRDEFFTAKDGLVITNLKNITTALKLTLKYEEGKPGKDGDYKITFSLYTDKNGKNIAKAKDGSNLQTVLSVPFYDKVEAKNVDFYLPKLIYGYDFINGGFLRAIADVGNGKQVFLTGRNYTVEEGLSETAEKVKNGERGVFDKVVAMSVGSFFGQMDVKVRNLPFEIEAISKPALYQCSAKMLNDGEFARALLSVYQLKEKNIGNWYDEYQIIYHDRLYSETVKRVKILDKSRDSINVTGNDTRDIKITNVTKGDKLTVEVEFTNGAIRVATWKLWN